MAFSSSFTSFSPFSSFFSSNCLVLGVRCFAPKKKKKRRTNKTKQEGLFFFANSSATCGVLHLLDVYVHDFHVVERLVLLVRPYSLDLVHRLHARDATPKDGVLVVQPRLRVIRISEEEETSLSGKRKRKEEKERKKTRTVALTVMKNWEPLVLGPALAMETV